MSIDYGFACFLHISYVFSVPLLIGIDQEPLTCCGCSNDTFGAQPFATTLLASFTLTNTGLRARNDQLEKFSLVIYYGLFKKSFLFSFRADQQVKNQNYSSSSLKAMGHILLDFQVNRQSEHGARKLFESIIAAS